MTTPLLSSKTYFYLFSLLGVVYVIGLFLPLIDNDSAHHANIGLRMYLTGDYVNMVDHRGDYIDKPHFLFWVSAVSYKIFGVTSFAYRFPSFLFTLAGTYSIYRLGKELYQEEVGKLAALIAASSFCYILANGDVRMDAMLTACIAFSLWQLVVFVHTKRTIPLLLAATGMAIGFITKGHVGFVTPAAGVFFYILYKKEWKLFYDWRWLLLLLVFGILITPVVYCFYLQYDLHPEKVSQGMKGVKGLKYILLTHSFDRISGHERFGTFAKFDRVYFFHTFLWTFAPWSVLMFMAFFVRLKNLLTRNYEWLTSGVFILLALLINFSYFKLPHYLPILAPVASIIVAEYLISKTYRSHKLIFIVQVIVTVIILLLAAIVNAWAFPVTDTFVIIIAVLILSLLFYFYLTKKLNKLKKAIAFSVTSMVLLFFLLNSNFYPKLLTYQGGKPLAEWSLNKNIDPKRVYFWPNTYSSSFNFYTASNRQVFHDSLKLSKEKYWIIFDKSQKSYLDSSNLNYTLLYSVKDYEISRMKGGFIDPSKRGASLGELVLAELIPQEN